LSWVRRRAGAFHAGFAGQGCVADRGGDRPDGRLLSLRERLPFTLYATAATFLTLGGNPIFGVLDPQLVTRRAITPGETLTFGDVGAEIFTVILFDGTFFTDDEMITSPPLPA
jgi:hypothetical protein